MSKNLIPFRIIGSAVPLGLACGGLVAAEMNERPVDGIYDNSFLIEEAYNQEKGVVQHILTGFYSVDKMSGPDIRDLGLDFTQEWPIFTQDHQFSYTIPYSFTRAS